MRIMASQITNAPNYPSEIFKMPGSMQIGPPTLRVRDLEEELSFYEESLGLQENRLSQDNEGPHEVVELGFHGKSKGQQDQLLILKHDPNARETPHDFAGLYHFAILVPDRKSLASALSAIEASGTRFEGFADHLVSEALYLHDPERNGIELYRDRPRGEWPRYSTGHIRMDTLPLDLDSLLGELSMEERRSTPAFPNGARIGHMHLRVTDLDRSLKFYSEKIGLEIPSFVSQFDFNKLGAGFLSAGGYHHHIGMNTWHSRGGKPHERGEAGLENFRINIPDGSPIVVLAKQLSGYVKTKDSKHLTVSDPDGIEVMVEVDAALRSPQS